jgi:hypothetical protein
MSLIDSPCNDNCTWECPGKGHCSKYNTWCGEIVDELGVEEGFKFIDKVERQ